MIACNRGVGRTMTRQVFFQNTILWVGLIGASVVAAAPPPASPQRAVKTSNLQEQVKGVDAKIATARAHNAALQAQMTQMEQQSALQQKQVQQRDAEIAALQQKLRAAGVPGSAASAGH